MSGATPNCESLGEVHSRLRPDQKNVIAGFILSVLSAGFGAFLLVRVWSSNVALVHALLPGTVAIALVGAGAALAVWANRMRTLCVCVCDEGFYYERRGRFEAFPWSEITLVQELITNESLPLLKGSMRNLVPTQSSRSYWVHRADGEVFVFTPNTLPRTSLLAGPLAVAMKARNTPWQTSGHVNRIDTLFLDNE